LSAGTSSITAVSKTPVAFLKNICPEDDPERPNARKKRVEAKNSNAQDVNAIGDW